MREQPWYRKGRGWYVQHRGKQVLLVKGTKDAATKAEAYKVFHELMATAQPEGPGVVPCVNELLVKFLEWAAREREPETAAIYRRRLRTFDRRFGAMAADEIRPHHVTAWVSAQRWNPTTRRNHLGTLKAAWRWAKREGYLESNPLAEVERPASLRRRHAMSREQAEALVNLYATGDPFRIFVEALVATGARPGEVARLTAAGVDLERGIWHVPNKVRRRTGQPTRAIHLTPELVDLSRALIGRHPEGPLFRNAAGKPWTRDSWAKRFGRARRRLGWDSQMTLYTTRHGFATEGIKRGVPSLAIAKLLGHKTTKMVDEVYAHLDDEDEYLKDALRKVGGRPE